ncbi:MAG: hypothetical protein NC331_12740 [Lachnospiraceae bacterium]|nr:hypothetical protein [Lachnospiraceae bacterium]MCM1240231.1 hypothetical protein [Lachnospiraceae bacterium]
MSGWQVCFWVVNFCVQILLGMKVWQFVTKRQVFDGRCVLWLFTAALALMVLIGMWDVFGSADVSGEEERVSANGDPADSLSPEADSGGAGESGQETEDAPEGSMFGYHDYTGYLDECVRWVGYSAFTSCDYDGDGITDRVWRENIRDWDVADYRIEFGNGDVIELPETAGGIPEVRSLDLDGDGIREILFTETFGYSTNPKAFGQMALLRKEGEDYRMMDIPGGMCRADSEEKTYDGTMAGYQPLLPLLYEPMEGYRMHVTCPALEKEKGLDSLDVEVDLTQEAWEMGGYDQLSPDDRSGSGVPYQVDILSMEDGRDALRLHFGVLDQWCDDDVEMILEWEDEALCIRDIRYRHDYIETAWARIGGEQYELILRGSSYMGEDQYTIDSILVEHTYYDPRFNGMVEETVQLIDPGEAAKQYWGTGYASDSGAMAQAVSSSRNGNILVADLNLDGNEDFCIQGWISGEKDIPYYCYFWNESTGQFEYGGCLANMEAE